MNCWNVLLIVHVTYICLIPHSTQNTFSLFIERQFYWKWFARPNPEATFFLMSFTYFSSFLQTQALSSLKCCRTILALLLKYVWLFINKGFKRALREKIFSFPKDRYILEKIISQISRDIQNKLAKSESLYVLMYLLLPVYKWTMLITN